MTQDTTVRQQILEYPDLVAALVAQASASSGVSCDEIAEQLGAYVDAERIGEHARPHYQALRAHLHICPLCYEDYALVQSIIAAQQAGDVPRWPLQAHAGIVLHRAELRRTLREQSGSADQAWPVYDGAVPDLPDTSAHVRLTRPAAADKDDWQIHIGLEGCAVAGLRIMLRYDAELRVQRTDETGSAIFPDVPARWLRLDATPDLLILFGAEERITIS